MGLNFCGLLCQIMKIGCNIPAASFLHTRTGRRTHQALGRDATAAKRDWVYITFPCAAKSRNSSTSVLGTSNFRDWIRRIGMRPRGWGVGFPAFLQLNRSLAAQSSFVCHYEIGSRNRDSLSPLVSTVIPPQGP